MKKKAVSAPAIFGVHDLASNLSTIQKLMRAKETAHFFFKKLEPTQHFYSAPLLKGTQFSRQTSTRSVPFSSSSHSQCVKPYYVYSNLLSLRCIEAANCPNALLAPLSYSGNRSTSSSIQTKSSKRLHCFRVWYVCVYDARTYTTKYLSFGCTIYTPIKYRQEAYTHTLVEINILFYSVFFFLFIPLCGIISGIRFLFICLSVYVLYRMLKITTEWQRKKEREREK